MKTAREWFETFPEPYRSRAIADGTDLRLKYPSAYLAVLYRVKKDGYYFDFWHPFMEKLRFENQ